MMKDIEKVKEILSSKEKFLENVWGVTFAFKCYSKNMNPKNLAFFKTYSTYNLAELGEFYDMYEFKEYGSREIKRVVKLGTIYKQYWVELCKKVDADSDTSYGYIWNIEMLLDVTNNGGQE